MICVFHYAVRSGYLHCRFDEPSRLLYNCHMYTSCSVVIASLDSITYVSSYVDSIIFIIGTQ